MDHHHSLTPVPPPSSLRSPDEHLTIGVIARNGLPFLRNCLAALPRERGASERPPAGGLSILLVDCMSGDGTTGVMTDFAHGRGDTWVFRVEGAANAAVARNVILDHAPPGFVLLLDGDMVLAPGFLDAALEPIRQGRAEAVIGALREQHFDTQNRPEGGELWRTAPVSPRYVRLAGGAILLGPQVRATGCRYDEGQRLCEDWDFALRLSQDHRILRIPDNLGLHLTHDYFSPHRLRNFYCQDSSRMLGQLCRKHFRQPWRLAPLVVIERGLFLGCILQALILLGMATGQFELVALALAALTADGGHSLIRGRRARWVATRLAAPWMLARGLLRPRPDGVDYRTARIA